MNKDELNKYGVDLVVLAEEGKIDNAIGREKELDQLLVSLSRRKKRNVLLLGDPGVGKTALVEGLAHTLSKTKTSQYKHILSLDMAGLMAGTKYRGELEEKFEQLLKFLVSSKEWILFIDEIHTFFSANQNQALSLGNIIKPYMTGNEIVIIGCTTVEEYNKYLSKDGAFTRRFNFIDVPSTDAVKTFEILKKSKATYEKHHGILYSDDVLKHAVNLAIKFLPQRALPDSAFDIIDEVGGIIKTRDYVKSDEITELEQELDRLEYEKLRVVKNHEWESIESIKKSFDTISTRLKELTKKHKASQKKQRVTIDDINYVTALQANLPLEWVSIGKASNKWSKIESDLNQELKGQSKVIKSILNSIKRKVSGLSSVDRPLGCFLLAGPGGTGKTSIGVKIAKTLWNDESKVIRINMSEYMESFNSSKLTGSAPGYEGYEKGSPLIKKLMIHPASILLFDQIELAHSSILNLLLQMLDEGFITDSQGKKVRLNQSVILLTTNIGTKELTYKSVGFAGGTTVISETIDKQIKKILSPELINRLDDVLYFETLNLENISDIISDRLSKMKDILKSNQNIDLIYSDQVVLEIAKQAEDPEKGAWKIAEVVQNVIIDPLSEYIIEQSMMNNTEISIEYVDSKLKFNHK